MGTAIDNSTIDFEAYERESPTKLVILDLKNFTYDICKESVATFMVKLNQLHPNALIVLGTKGLPGGAWKNPVVTSAAD